MSNFLFFLLLLLCNCSEKQDLKNEKRNLQSPSTESEDYDNIRIDVDTTCITLGKNSKAIINKAVEKAKETIQRIVKVKTIKNGIEFEKYGFDYISKLSDNFISCNLELHTKIADLVIFVRTAQSDEASDSGVPEIKLFLNNNENNRPIVGIINYFWNTYLNDLDDDSKVEVVYSHFLHEITHILGFNKTILYNKRLVYKKSQQMRMNSIEVEKYFYRGKNVIDRAKKYYNYPGLTELEMDDVNGKEASDGSKIHWSERLLLGEYMTPSFYFSEQIISEFTLDLLKDLGWYEINYFTGGLMRFGKNRGCDFMNSDCVKQFNDKSLKTTFQNEFCSNAY